MNYVITTLQPEIHDVQSELIACCDTFKSARLALRYHQRERPEVYLRILTSEEFQQLGYLET